MVLYTHNVCDRKSGGEMPCKQQRLCFLNDKVANVVNKCFVPIKINNKIINLLSNP